VSPSADLTNLTSWWGVLLVAVLLAAVSQERERERARMNKLVQVPT
jgi:hypothetical protein